MAKTQKTYQQLGFNTARKWTDSITRSPIFQITNSTEMLLSKYEEYKSSSYKPASIVDIYYLWKIGNIKHKIDDEVRLNELFSFFKQYNFDNSQDIYLNTNCINEAIEKYRKYVESAKKVMSWLEYEKPEMLTNVNGTTFKSLYFDTKKFLELIKSKDFTILIGQPGTGKTYQAIEMTKTAEKVQVISLSNLVGNNFVYRANKTEGKIANYEALSYAKCRYADEDCYDTIIFEESSMLDTSTLSVLIKKCEQAKRIIFCGDTNQLPGFVGFGNILYSLIQQFPEHVIELKTNYRCPPDVVNNMDNIINQGKFTNTQNEKDIIPMWLKLLKEKQDCVMVTLENKTVDEYNYMLMYNLFKNDDNLVSFNNASRILMQEKPIIQEKNAAKETFCAAAVKAGYTIPMRCQNKLSIQYTVDGKKETVVKMFNNEICDCTINGNQWELRSRSNVKHIMTYNIKDTWHMFKDFDICYSMTVHKSQGLEFDYVWYKQPNNSFMETRNLAYVGYTRSKKRTFVSSNNNIIKKLMFKNIFRFMDEHFNKNDDGCVFSKEDIFR